MNVNAMPEAKSNASPKTKIPSSKTSVGYIYCKNPTTLKGNRFVPSEYNSSGIAVANPLKAIISQKYHGRFPETPLP